MRRPRVYGIGIAEPIYHTMTRAVDGKWIFESEEEKAVLRGFLEDQCLFSGLELLTYCCMSNHVHLLLRVPLRPDDIPPDEVFKRMRAVQRPKRVADFRDRVEHLLHQGHAGAAEEQLDRIRGRMYDVSAFMKQVKQRYTAWYNHKEGRRGTLWGERFKSNLVQDGEALRVMAAYIDLNPVRAGMVKSLGGVSLVRVQ